MTIMAMGRAFSSLDFPFVFGGDGMSALIPPSSAPEIRNVLARAVRDIRKWFDLELRAALFPLSIFDEKQELRISKTTISKTYRQAIFHGGHLGLAEDLLKNSRDDERSAKHLSADEYRIDPADDEVPGDYDGFTCRWQDIPTYKEHTIALVVSFRNPDAGFDTVREIEALLSAAEGGFHPLEASKMVPGGKSSNYRVRPLIASSGNRRSIQYLFQIVLELLIIVAIRACIRLNIPVKTSMYQINKIREQNVGSSDFRKFDGGLKMVFAASKEELEEIAGILKGGYDAGDLFYGIHTSDAAHMTCIAHLPSGDDIHFVDATNGGYTMAAKAMKLQMSEGQRG